MDTQKSINPFFSIVVPVYNTAPYLDSLCNSILAQDYTSFEVIFINDASTDNSQQVLANYHDKRFIYLENSQNSGPSISRNKGIAKARGEYLLFLDSDDEIFQHALYTIHQALQESPDMMAFDGIMRQNNKEKTIKLFTETFSLQSGTVALKKLQKISAAYWVYKKSFLSYKNLRFMENIFHEDELFVYETLLQAEHVSYLPAKIYLQKKRPGSITTSPNLKRVLDRVFICQKLSAYHEDLLQVRIFQLLCNSFETTHLLPKTEQKMGKKAIMDFIKTQPTAIKGLGQWVKFNIYRYAFLHFLLQLRRLF
jgi:glycosyltransferase involved in cell wall biosynthesis